MSQIVITILIMALVIMLIDPFFLISIIIFYYLRQLRLKLNSSKKSQIALLKLAIQSENIATLVLARKILILDIIMLLLFLLCLIFIAVSVDFHHLAQLGFLGVFLLIIFAGLFICLYFTLQINRQIKKVYLGNIT